MATFTYQDFLKMMEEPEKCLSASQELKHFNIIPEYHSLRQIEEKTSFELARMNILQYIITCVKNDPINGDYYNKESIDTQLLDKANVITLNNSLTSTNNSLALKAPINTPTFTGPV
jgi:hypothetical protein